MFDFSRFRDSSNDKSFEEFLKGLSVQPEPVPAADNTLGITEVEMIVDAISTHVSFLKGVMFTTNDEEIIEDLVADIADYQLLKEKLENLLPEQKEIEEEFDPEDEEDDLSAYRNADNVRFIRDAENMLGLHRVNLEVLDDEEFVEYLSYLDLATNTADESEVEW